MLLHCQRPPSHLEVHLAAAAVVYAWWAGQDRNWPCSTPPTAAFFLVAARVLCASAAAAALSAAVGITAVVAVAVCSREAATTA